MADTPLPAGALSHAATVSHPAAPSLLADIGCSEPHRRRDLVRRLGPRTATDTSCLTLKLAAPYAWTLRCDFPPCPCPPPRRAAAGVCLWHFLGAGPLLAKRSHQPSGLRVAQGCAPSSSLQPLHPSPPPHGPSFGGHGASVTPSFCSPRRLRGGEGGERGGGVSE